MWKFVEAVQSVVKVGMLNWCRALSPPSLRRSFDFDFLDAIGVQFKQSQMFLSQYKFSLSKPSLICGVLSCFETYSMILGDKTEQKYCYLTQK